LLERARVGLDDTVMRGFMLALFLHVIGQGASFVLQIVYARIVGTAEYGSLSVAFAWISVCLIGCKIGFDTTLLRLLPLYQSSQQWGHFRGLLMVGRYLPTAVTCMVALVATGVLLQWPGVWDSSLGTTLLLAAWFLPLAVYSELTAAALRALQRFALAIAGEAIARPVLGILLVAALYCLRDARITSTGAFATYLAATVVSASLVSIWLRRFAPAVQRSVPRRFALRHWLGVSAPLLVASAFQALLYSVDVIMIGTIATPAESGIYNAAGKLSMLALFAMNAIQLAAGPLISAAIARNDRTGLRRVVRTATLTSLAISVPIVLAMILFRRSLLSMFGAEFEAGAPALAILALAQLFNTATGPVGLILGLSGQQHRLVACLGLGLVVNVVLNLLWIPRHGVVGAACAATVAHVCWNSAAVAAVVKHVAVNPTAFPFWRASSKASSARGGES
jgi:O-antigen/teichoic acid export membrane protein